jgi:hypothetical protein
MYELLHGQKQALQAQWVQIAPNELTADLTPTDALTLQELWIRIAPKELFDYAATLLEHKAAFELNYDIPGFFAPDVEEMEAFERDYRKHAASYILWK